jgi:hypothetical protein
MFKTAPNGAAFGLVFVIARPCAPVVDILERQPGLNPRFPVNSSVKAPECRARPVSVNGARIMRVSLSGTFPEQRPCQGQPNQLYILQSDVGNSGGLYRA